MNSCIVRNLKGGHHSDNIYNMVVLMFVMLVYMHLKIKKNMFADLNRPSKMKAAIDKILSLVEGDGIKELQHHLTSLSHDQVCI